jgi:alpha-tubulin suppressor-like RCC1 family protein
MTQNNLPTKVVSGLSGVSALSGGADHLLLLESSGVVMACGNGTYGELGDGGTADSDVAVQVQGLTNVVAISAGSQNSVALDSSGRVWDWGNNNLGQLGDGNTFDSDVPVEVSLPSAAVQVFAGGDSTSDGSVLALLGNGEVYAWGDDSNGQLGDGATGTSSDVPVRTRGLPSNIVAVATDAYTSYALDSSGNLYAWGRVNRQNETTPTIVQTGVSRVSAVAATTVTSSSS